MGSAENHRAVGVRMLSRGHVGGGHLTGGHVGPLTTTTTTAATTTTTSTTTRMASAVTKVAATMEVEIEARDNVTLEVLEEAFRRGIADALTVSIEDVVKLTVVEIGQGSGSRRLQSTKVRQYEVSYEVIPPKTMDPSVVVDK